MALVSARVKKTGEIVKIPESWLTHDRLGAPYEAETVKTKSSVKSETSKEKK
ncbi:hypothetical protein [Flaviflexus equikiangi]|uniref:Uncharacterized protein n=1 Tax=Flaviflexus equikiangi TaxID=2758573 RepID=A0ABS2TCH0_9ACTO|nr:hypothetical protein [Flaviflexus equikiangi]MBM9432339.1 hypothetical protein [Flaviflexus equikiangi]